MVELLGTYTAENASAAREDAQRCILAALVDPNTFLLDPLLALKPVRFLEGELIHDLLLVFVQDKLPAYLDFYQHHKEFVEHQLGMYMLYICIYIIYLFYSIKVQNVYYMISSNHVNISKILNYFFNKKNLCKAMI